VSRHQANILFRTLRTPPEEEEERAGGGGAESERVVRGAAEVEGTSMVMVGDVEFLRLEVGDHLVLQELPSDDPPNHHHDLWGIPTTVESCPRNDDDLLKHEIK
jgi:hypothetical protein